MPPTKTDENLLVEDARILFRNFSGIEREFNSKGDRNFVLVLDTETATLLENDGWNVKYLKAREEGETPTPYINVKVNYDKGRPPRCVVITSKQRNEWGADEVGALDSADIKKVDVIVRPYNWEVNGNTGIKAYLKTIFVWLNEDELELKYADLLADAKDGLPDEEE